MTSTPLTDARIKRIYMMLSIAQNMACENAFINFARAIEHEIRPLAMSLTDARRIYIAGPMSGIPELNFPAFHATAAELRALGFEVVNPAEIDASSTVGMTAEQYQAHWQACMRKDIAALMTCTGVYMLPGWANSRGAALERHIAVSLGLTTGGADA